jgi:hypothetical protein
MVCFAVVVMASSTAFAGDKTDKRMLRGNKKIIKQLDTVQQTLDNQVIGNQETIQQTLDNVIIPMLEQCGNCPECPPCPGGKAGVPKTGQTLCYPEGVGGPIPCAGTGQDGDLQKGTPWPIPRFTENDNGTITDNMTGLVWLESANCFTTATWTNALATCNTLEDGQCALTDGSSVGDWRLPNIREMLTLIDYAYRYPALSNTEGTDQWTPGNPFTWAGGVFPDYPAQVGYWTSTTKRGNGEHAWYVHLEGGNVGYGHKWVPDEISFWPVRDLRPDEQ